MSLNRPMFMALALLAAVIVFPAVAGSAHATGRLGAVGQHKQPVLGLRAERFDPHQSWAAEVRSNSGLGLTTADQDPEESRPPTIYLPLGLRNAAPQPPLPPKAWCEQVIAGPAGTGGLVELSAVHSSVRFFGVEPHYRTADQALVSLVDHLGFGPSAADPQPRLSDLQAYAAGMNGVCALGASSGTLGRASVETRRGIATIHPGTGEVRLQSGTKAVVIDLRGLPAVDGLQAALDSAVAPALGKSVDRPVRRVRRHYGMTDELFYATNVYSNATAAGIDPPITATGQADLPIALLTGPTLAPQAAELAGTLRLANRAWIVGQDVHAGVAEAHWSGVGEAGLAWRAAELEALRRPHPPEMLNDLVVRQDKKYDQTSSSIKHTVTATEQAALSVTLTGQEDADLDLYLIYDANQDGEFDYVTELISLSGGPTADEHIPLTELLPAGSYQVWVHGYNVPERRTTAGLEIDLLYGSRWPDVIPADAVSDDPVSNLPDLPNAGNPPPLEPSGSLRQRMLQVAPYDDVQPVARRLAELRAALLVLHGATRQFFPYFPVVGDGIDDRLRETWARAATCGQSPYTPLQIDRTCARDTLRRFGEVLKDGHNFTYDRGPSTVVGYFPVFLEQINGEPVVRRSAAPGVEPGDTIVTIDGRPASQWYAEQYERTSAATEAYRFDLASRYLTEMTGPLELELRSPGGTVRPVHVEPQLEKVYKEVSATPSAREAGNLADLGAPELYYINMDDTVLGNVIADFRDALRDAEESAGMVLDMRGDPGDIDRYEAAQRLITSTFKSPVFRVPVRLGPGALNLVREQFQLQPLDDPSFHGPIAFIVGPHTVSDAEDFALMLVGAHRVTVVGRRSGGTDGRITGVQLPGGFAASFSGTETRFPDGATFHGVGIQPDVPVELKASDFKDGKDPELLAAIAALGGGPHPPTPSPVP